LSSPTEDHEDAAATSLPAVTTPHQLLAGAEGMARAIAARRLVPGAEGSPALARLAELAARLLGAEAAQVSLLSEVQDVAAAAGTVAHTVGTAGPIDESLCTVTLMAGEPLVVPDAAQDERVALLPPVASGRVGSYLGVPLVTDRHEAIGAFCVLGSRPREWTDHDVALLQQLAAPVVAELELAALTADYETGRVVWQLAIDAAGIGAFDWDLASGDLTWDDRLLELFGLTRSTFGGTIEAFRDVVHPEDRTRVSQALQGAVQSCGEYTAEYRIVLPGGETRWITARGRALAGEDGTAVRLLGAAFDSTAAREGETAVARILEAMPTAFFSVDRQWRFEYVNAEAERLLGRTRGELVGGDLWELFPSASDSEFDMHYRRAMDTGEVVMFDAYYPEPLNAWYEIRAWPTPSGLSVYFFDVTARRTAQAELEQAVQRSALLARVTSELAGTLEAEKAVARLAQLLVPDVADWCVVTLVNDDPHPDWRRGLRDVGWWHADPSRRALLEKYAEHRIDSLTDSSFVARAMATGEPVLVPDGAREAIGGVLQAGPARDLFNQLDPHAVAVVPLRGRGRIVGLVTVFRDAGRTITVPELDVLRDVAARAGLALDNARLFAQQRELAATLQRSLMTDPPEPDHLEVVVRYEPAAQAAQVGGDWYDAFRQQNGALLVVIGDVVGHDTAAAAAMGQVRTLLRAVAAHTGDGPAEVLRGVDKVMRTLDVETTATAVIARLEQTEEQRLRGQTAVRWSNAGHPPAAVIDPEGRVSLLADVESDLLLGLDPETSRKESVAVLERGSTMLLYTDGLVERRGRGFDVGIAELQEALSELATQELPLVRLCQELVQRLLPERPEDDVALVAVRLHPEDRPAPKHHAQEASQASKPSKE
jgi:PAS domain S-box-containing protein